MHAIFRRRVMAALVLGAALAGCGGGGDGTAPPPAGDGGDDGSGTGGPAATLTAPVAFAANLTGTQTLTATVAAGAAAVEFQVDGLAVGEDTTAPFAVTVDTAAYAAGQHMVRVRGRDAAGNVSAWSGTTVQFGGSGVVPAGFTRNEAWLSAPLTNATAFAPAPDGRWFVAEQGGTLRVVRNGALLPTPLHTFTVNSVGERGLLGVAVHPDFANNGYVYVYYTSTEGSIHNRVARLRAIGDVSDGTVTVLQDLPTLVNENHNGGALHFGADGRLYVAVGDAGVGTNAQDLASPFGKLLRLNADGSIPADNPFYASQSGLARAIWAYGLRNPYTFAIEPGTGRMHINDVGGETWEEIDVGAAGANYGWPASEGPSNVTAGITGPIFAYGHAAASPPGSGPGGFYTGIAITGGAFYPPTGGSFPAGYGGSYFFADFLSRFVARLVPGTNQAGTFARVSGNPVDMRVGTDGALYVLTRTGITRIAPP